MLKSWGRTVAGKEREATVHQEYEVIIIGSGPAGQAVLSECHSSGLRLAMVEARELGGTCPLRGCDPKKVLVGAAEIIRRAQGLAGRGIQSRNKIQWSDLIRFKKTFTDPIPAEMEKRLAEYGVDLYRGRARFAGKNRLQVGERTLTGKHLVIATGAVPRKLNVPGEEWILSSDQFLDLKALPDSIVFIGGGYISFEFAHIAAQAGAKAVILHRSARPLKNFDPDLVRLLVEAMERAGVKVHVDMPVKAVEKTKRGFLVLAGEKEQHSFNCRFAVHGAGRVPDLASLGLQEGEIEASSRGVVVNRYLQSISNPAVYAAGDAAATPFFLTPTANLEGKIIAGNIRTGNTVQADYSAVPSVVFTFPPLAAVGQGEEDLKKKDWAFECKFADTSSWFESRRIGLERSGMKLLIEKNSGKLLGAHLLADHAEETINVFALAIRLGLTTEDLKGMPWAYPSSVSEMGYLVG
jgi:glutathione reductase (NADPH)